MYARVPYYTKIKSKRKFKIQNIELSKIFLPTVCVTVAWCFNTYRCVCVCHKLP